MNIADVLEYVAGFIIGYGLMWLITTSVAMRAKKYVRRVAEMVIISKYEGDAQGVTEDTRHRLARFNELMKHVESND